MQESRTQWRIHGGSCLSYGLLASRRTDIAIDTGLSIHDYAAFRPLIEEVGGASRPGTERRSRWRPDAAFSRPAILRAIATRWPCFAAR